MVHINKYFVCELLEEYLSQLGYYYTCNKSNKKKIVELFHSLPFFFFGQKEQSILYKVIQKNNVTAFIDSNESMKKLCHNIYKDFCMTVNYPHKEYDEYYKSIKYKINHDTYYMKKMKQKHIHSFVFCLLFIGIVCIYYILSKRLYT